MVKPFLILALVLFMLGGMFITSIFQNWKTERTVRLWERMRVSGFSCLWGGKYDDAQQFFEKGRALSRTLGSTNYRYGRSLADLALVMEQTNKFDRAKQLLTDAIHVLDTDQKSNRDLHVSIVEDEVQVICQLAKLQIKSKQDNVAVTGTCQQALAILEQNPQAGDDGLTVRTLAHVLLLASDYLSTQNDPIMAAEFLSQASSLIKRTAMLSDLESSVGKKIKQSRHEQTESAADLLERGEHFMEKHSRNLEEAERFLLAAKEEGLKSNDPCLVKIRLDLAVIALGRDDFEHGEQELVAVLKDPRITEEIADKTYSRLSGIYRQSVQPALQVDVLRPQIVLREKIYGKETSKVADLHILLASAFQQMGKQDEAESECRLGYQYYAKEKNGMFMKADSVPPYTGGVMGRSNKISWAVEFLEPRVHKFAAGEASGKGAIACIDLAATQLLAGDPPQKWQPLFNGGLACPGLESAEKLLLADTLREWSIVLDGKPEAALFLKQMILIMAAPEGRRDALRVYGNLATFDRLLKNNPNAIDGSVRAHQKVLQAALKKFPPFTPKGFVNQPE